MQLLLTEINSFLGVNSVGIVGVNIFKSTMPSTPNSCVSVNGDGGPRGYSQFLHTPSIQIMIRDSVFASGMERTEFIYSLLNDTWNVLSTIKGWFKPVHEPGVFFRDSNQRYVFTLNFNLFTTGNTI